MKNKTYGRVKVQPPIKDTYKNGLPESDIDLTPQRIIRSLEKIVDNQRQQNEDLIESLNTNFDLLSKELIKSNSDSAGDEKTGQHKLSQAITELQANLIKAIQDNQLQLPEELKVQVSNPQSIEKTEFPKVQKVEVTNKVQQVKITNPTREIQLPINKGNNPRTANPSIYIPVRLTNGERFYNAIAEAYVAAGQKTFPFVNYQTGKPQAANVDDNGNIVFPPLTVSGIQVTLSGITTVSGSQTDIKNFPTVQTVNVQNMPVTISGLEHVSVDNFPTVQKVSILDLPPITVSGIENVTTISGSKTDIQNFPTVQTVNVQNLTTISGQQNMHVDNFPTVQSVQVLNQRTLASGIDSVAVNNFPTVQKVSIQDMPPIMVSGVENVTTISGSKTDVQNFPTVQTVNVQNLTTISGQQNMHIDNFPTVQKVSIQDLPTITAQLISDGVTTAVSGTVTTISGSKTDVQNFPTIQTVNVANIVPITSVSGTQHTVIDNFPTYQTVNVNSIVPVTSLSGTMHALIDNFPTIQTINLNGNALPVDVSNWVQFADRFAMVGGLVSGTNAVAAAAIMPLTRAWLTTLKDAAGLDLGTASNPIRTSPTGNTTVSGTTLTISGSKTDVQNFPTIQTVNVANIIPITSTSGTMHAVIDNYPTIRQIYGQVVGDVASQAPDSSNPIKIGGSRRATLPTYADGVRAALHVDENGVLLVRGVQPLSISGTINTTSVSGMQHTFIDNIPTFQSVNINSPLSSIMPPSTVPGVVVREASPGFVSTVNSSTTPLAGGGVFTGTAEDVTQYASITVTVFADVASATDGLMMQQSSDGGSWDNSDTYTVPASTGKSFGVQASAKFFRLVYTNGAGAQAAFRLQTIFHKWSQRTSTIRPQDGRSNDNDMTEVVSYQSVYNAATNSWDRAQEIFSGLNSVGTGIPAVGMVGSFDDVSPALVTENQFAPARISARREQYVTTISGSLRNGAETTVSGIASQILAANPLRKGFIIQNTGVANGRIAGTGVTATTGLRLTPGGDWTYSGDHVPTDALFAIREGSVSTTILAMEIL